MTSSVIAADLAVLRPWWLRLFPTAPTDVRGLWFGITDLVWSVGVQRTMYVAGTPTFDREDQSAEWATDYCWWPDGRYVVLPMLASMPGTDLVEFGALLEHAAALVRLLRPQSDIEVDGVAVGFDDGDFLVTWPERDQTDEGRQKSVQ